MTQQTDLFTVQLGTELVTWGRAYLGKVTVSSYADHPELLTALSFMRLWGGHERQQQRQEGGARMKLADGEVVERIKVGRLRALTACLCVCSPLSHWFVGAT